MKRVQQECHFQFQVIIIRETEQDICKTETIHFPLLPDTSNHGYIPIGYEINFLTTFRPEVVVLGYHQQITRFQFFLPIKNHVADTFIIDIRPFIGAAYHYRVVHSYPIITIRYRLNKLIAWYHLNIREIFYLYGRKSKEILFRDKTAKFRRIPKNTRIMQLTNHLRQHTFVHFQAISFQGSC